MAVQRPPRNNSRDESENKPDIAQPNMRSLVARNSRQASISPLNVFFGWSHSLKM